MIIEENKISLCTIAMNRVDHVRKTLISNIEDNIAHENLEHVLLDYNSTDGLGDYIRNNFQSHLLSKRLVYFRYDDADFYNASHSRNLAFKLATGNILCNVDADNFTGPGFAKMVSLTINENLFLSTINETGDNPKTDILGRLCITRKQFLNVRGYDESMLHYGYEDYDIIARLQIAGYKKIYCNHHIFDKTISHGNNVRLQNGYNHKKKFELIISQINPGLSHVILLYEDSTFVRGSMINVYGYRSFFGKHLKETGYEYEILEDAWIIGRWKLVEYTLILESVEDTMKLVSNANGYGDAKNSLSYIKVHSNEIKEQLLFFVNQSSNRLIMSQNKVKSKFKVNDVGFGRGVVVKNFDTKRIYVR